MFQSIQCHIQHMRVCCWSIPKYISSQVKSFLVFFFFFLISCEGGFVLHYHRDLHLKHLIRTISSKSLKKKKQKKSETDSNGRVEQIKNTSIYIKKQRIAELTGQYKHGVVTGFASSILFLLLLFFNLFFPLVLLDPRETN